MRRIRVEAADVRHAVAAEVALDPPVPHERRDVRGRALDARHDVALVRGRARRDGGSANAERVGDALSGVDRDERRDQLVPPSSPSSTLARGGVVRILAREIHIPVPRVLWIYRVGRRLAPQTRRPRGADGPRARIGVGETSTRRRPDVGVANAVRHVGVKRRRRLEVHDIFHVRVPDEFRRQALHPRARGSQSAPPAELLGAARVRDADGRRGGRVLEPVRGFLGWVVREAERREPCRRFIRPHGAPPRRARRLAPGQVGRGEPTEDVPPRDILGKVEYRGHR